MKHLKPFTILLIIAIFLGTAKSVDAQVGGTEKSVFVIQNISDRQASVTVTFIDVNGQSYVPNPLLPNANPVVPNPFILDPGLAKEIYVPYVQIPNGDYSVEVTSDQRVVATFKLFGDGGPSNPNFNGAYSSMAVGNLKSYLPAFLFNRWNWYSTITIQNVGDQATDVRVDITCENVQLNGSYTKSSLQPKASVTFNSKQITPSGFQSSTQCNGSALVTSYTSPVIATDNQVIPSNGTSGGNTQSYNGLSDGAGVIYIPSLFTSFYGWNSSINIAKIDSGETDIYVYFSDITTVGTCHLGDPGTPANLKPSCLLYMPTVHGTNKAFFGATIVATNNNRIVAVANAANNSQAQTYSAFVNGTNTVYIPSVFYSYYNWNSSFDCQNLSNNLTQLHVKFSNNITYNPSTQLSQGQVLEIYVPSVVGLQPGFSGSVTVTATNSFANIACSVNQNASNGLLGDWSTSTNAFNK